MNTQRWQKSPNVHHRPTIFCVCIDCNTSPQRVGGRGQGRRGGKGTRCSVDVMSGDTTLRKAAVAWATEAATRTAPPPSPTPSYLYRARSLRVAGGHGHRVDHRRVVPEAVGAVPAAQHAYLQLHVSKARAGRCGAGCCDMDKLRR